MKRGEYAKQMPYSLVLSDISVTRDEGDIQDELMQNYDGIINVQRWYFDDDQDYPMSCVQVDFNSQDNLNQVLKNGNMISGGVCRRISIIPESKCYRCQKSGHQVKNCAQDPLNEKYLIILFAEQKR